MGEEGGGGKTYGVLPGSELGGHEPDVVGVERAVADVLLHVRVVWGDAEVDVAADGLASACGWVHGEGEVGR